MKTLVQYIIESSYKNNPLLSKEELEYWDNLKLPNDKEYARILKLTKTLTYNQLYKKLGYDKYNAFMTRFKQENETAYKEYMGYKDDELPW